MQSLKVVLPLMMGIVGPLMGISFWAALQTRPWVLPVVPYLAVVPGAAEVCYWHMWQGIADQEVIDEVVFWEDLGDHMTFWYPWAVTSCTCLVAGFGGLVSWHLSMDHFFGEHLEALSLVDVLVSVPGEVPVLVAIPVDGLTGVGRDMQVCQDCAAQDQHAWS